MADRKNNPKQEVSTDEKGGMSVDFMNNLLHEIRSPLFVAKTESNSSNSKLALKEMSSKLDSISEAFEWEQGLVPLHKSFVRITDLVEMLQEDFPENISFEIDESVENNLFEIDVLKIKEALAEIIKNSFFFNTSKEKKVTLHFSYNDGDMVISIQDNGIGIEEQNWEKIFELLFVESESRNASECGLGVGLTKANGIIKAHQGNCQVKKSSQDGTFLVLTLESARR